MFQKIQQLIDDKDALVFVLIDEVSFNKSPKVLKISVYKPFYFPTATLWSGTLDSNNSSRVQAVKVSMNIMYVLGLNRGVMYRETWMQGNIIDTEEHKYGSWSSCCL